MALTMKYSITHIYGTNTQVTFCHRKQDSDTILIARANQWSFFRHWAIFNSNLKEFLSKPRVVAINKLICKQAG